MVPNSILFIKEIPLTASGKVDRINLISQIQTETEQFEREYIEPENKLEKEIAGIWEELLELENIGVTEDFFQLGGHSLLATQLVNKVSRKYHIEISLKSFLFEPTIRELARKVDISKQFSGIDPIRLVMLIEKVKQMSSQEVTQLAGQLKQKS